MLTHPTVRKLALTNEIAKPETKISREQTDARYDRAISEENTTVTLNYIVHYSYRTSSKIPVCLSELFCIPIGSGAIIIITRLLTEPRWGDQIRSGNSRLGYALKESLFFYTMRNTNFERRPSPKSIKQFLRLK